MAGRRENQALPWIDTVHPLRGDAILVEAGHNAKIRRQLAETGSRVNAGTADQQTQAA